MTRQVVGADVAGVVEYVELISTRPCDCPKRVASSIARRSLEGSELSAVSVLASNMGV